MADKSFNRAGVLRMLDAARGLIAGAAECLVQAGLDKETVTVAGQVRTMLALSCDSLLDLTKLSERIEEVSR